MKLSPNISVDEIVCQCGCGYGRGPSAHKTMRPVIEVAQAAHDHFERVTGKKLYIGIGSGCRCMPHNINQRGAKMSLHMKARALDFWLYDKDGNRVPTEDLFNYIREHWPKISIGKYPNGRVHIDDKRQWRTW